MNVSSEEINNIVLKLIKVAQSKSRIFTDVIEGTIEDVGMQELEARDGVYWFSPVNVSVIVENMDIKNIK